MKRELKNLLNYLKDYSRENRGFFGSELEWIVLYLFLRRYDDIREYFDLSHFGYDIEKYLIDKSNDYYPYDDIIKPFFNFLTENNENVFENISLDDFFMREDELYSLSQSEIQTLNRAIKKNDIKDFRIDSFSVEEFDKFFTALIELTKSQSEKSIYRRVLNKEFAKFLSAYIPENGTNIYFGDETGELIFQSESDDGVKILTGGYDSILWYYLRGTLTGKKNIQVRINELTPFIEDRADFIFVNPPVGRIPKNLLDYFKSEFKNQHYPKHCEVLYINLMKSAIKDDGRAFVLVPSSFLFQNVKEYINVRKELTEDGNLRSIIKFPRGLFNPLSSVSYTLIELDFSTKADSIKFIDGTEIFKSVSPDDPKRLNHLFSEINFHWKEGIGFYPFVKNVNLGEIREVGYSLAFSNYFSVAEEADKHIRSRKEVLLPLTNVLRPLKLKSEKNKTDISVIGITQLADNFAEFKINHEDLPVVKNPKRVKKLGRSAILIGKILGSIKPSFFDYNGKEVYLKQNVIPFDIPDGYDIQYLVQELRSDFVLDQFRKAESAKTIPSYSNRILSNIYLRIPPLYRQREIVKEELSKLAKSKVEEVEQISKDMRVIEREYLSGFKHDFMQILGNLSSGMNNIETYIQQKADDGVIDLSDPVVPYLTGDKIDPDNTIDNTFGRVRANISTAIDFLEVEMERMLSGLNDESFEILEISSFIKDWKESVSKKNNFEIKVGKSEDWPKSKNILVRIVPTLMKSLLRNLLKNAMQHGFIEKKQDYEFWIHLGLAEENDSLYAKLLIYNNGIPYEDGYSFEDFIKARTSAGENRSTGLGGAQISRLAEEMNMIFREPVYPVNKELYPVQFELLIPIEEKNESTH